MRLPAEWEKQQYVLFTFPNADGDWGAALEPASRAMLAAAELVNRVTPVVMIVGDAQHFAPFADSFSGRVLEIKTDDSWVRDYGPLTVFERGRPELLDFRFNGWGGKFFAENDDRVAAVLPDLLSLAAPLRRVAFELEGGSIESDGRGTILTTSTCLLNPNRNHGGVTRGAAESVLREQLGAERVLWLHHGELSGDDTDAHVDTLARFTDADTIAYVSCADAGDGDFRGLQAMQRELRQFRTRAGKPYRLIPLPHPPAIFSADDGHRLPTSYANFLISNGTLFLPTYFDGEAEGSPGRRADELAAARLREGTDYVIQPVPCRPFIEQHGSLHCLTMQIPAF